MPTYLKKMILMNSPKRQEIPFFDLVTAPRLHLSYYSKNAILKVGPFCGPLLPFLASLCVAKLVVRSLAA